MPILTPSRALPLAAAPLLLLSALLNAAPGALPAAAEPAAAPTPVPALAPAVTAVGTKAPAATTATIRPDPDLPPIAIPPELLEALNGMAAQSSQAMAEVNALLAENIQSIENAEQIFDRMAETIRAAAAQGAPGSKLVEQLDKLADMARSDATQAKLLESGDLAKWLTAAATSFEESKGEAIQIYTSSFERLRDIERERKRFILAMKVKQYSLAQQNVRKGLEVLQALDQQIAEVYDKLPERGMQDQ